MRPPAVGSRRRRRAADAGATVPDDGLFPAETGAPEARRPKRAPRPGDADGAAQPHGGRGRCRAHRWRSPACRSSRPAPRSIRISLLELQSGNPEKNIPLQAGDTVFFPRASQVYVMGSVARPGPYRFQEGMTVLQVLTLAGGATERGSAGRAKFVRIVDGKKVEHEGEGRPTSSLPEDTLYVPERFF